MSALERLRALLREERGIDDQAEGDYQALERALRGEQPLGATLGYLASRPCYAGDLADQAWEEEFRGPVRDVADRLEEI